MHRSSFPSSVLTVALLALLLHAAAAQETTQQPATVILPANVVVQPSQQSQQQPQALPAEQRPLQPQPSVPPPPPTPPKDTTQEEALAAACPELDTVLADKYDAFFLLLRLVDMYTLSPSTQPTPALNSTYEPLTILVPKDSTVEFLRAQNIDISLLAKDPLQSVLLAPTLAQHFIRGYWPANALPVEPVETLCGVNCAPVTFRNEGEEVRVYSGNANVTVTGMDIVNCPGRYVVHTVDDYLYTPVTNPLEAAGPALNLAYTLGGKFDTYPVAPAEQGATSG